MKLRVEAEKKSKEYPNRAMSCEFPMRQILLQLQKSAPYIVIEGTFMKTPDTTNTDIADIIEVSIETTRINDKLHRVSPFMKMLRRWSSKC